jgi:hypothetical protein
MTSPPLTPEDHLILACARTGPDVERIRRLVERGPDWPGILRKAERWGLVPLVYASLRQAAPSDQVPPSVTDSLRQLYRRDTIRGIARRELLRATLLRFSEASVPVIVLKGAALAALVYPSPTLRPMADVDLLVRGCDLGWVDELLRGMRDGPHPIPHLGLGGLSLLDVRDHICSPGVAHPGRQKSLASRSMTSGGGRDPPRSSPWPRSCSAPRICSCTSRST